MENMRNLLAGCLRESANGDVVDTLLEAYPNNGKLMNGSEGEICLIKGIGVVKAKQLKVILELARKAYELDVNKRVIIK